MHGHSRCHLWGSSRTRPCSHSCIWLLQQCGLQDYSSAALTSPYDRISCAQEPERLRKGHRHPRRSCQAGRGGCGRHQVLQHGGLHHPGLCAPGPVCLQLDSSLLASACWLQPAAHCHMQACCSCAAWKRTGCSISCTLDCEARKPCNSPVLTLQLPRRQCQAAGALQQPSHTRAAAAGAARHPAVHGQRGVLPGHAGATFPGWWSPPRLAMPACCA